MPDGRFVPLGSYEARAAAHRYIGEAETVAELIEAGKQRALGLMVELEDAFGEIEREAPGAMRYARLLLADARSEVEGTR